MDKIKVYSSSSSKGSVDNPYTKEEYDNIIESGKDWPGGYVEGMGYVFPDVVVKGSILSDDSWFDSWFDFSDPWASSSYDGSSSSSSSEPSQGTGSGSTGGSGGHHSSGTSTPNNLNKPFPTPQKHLSVGKCVRVLSVRLAKTSVSTLSKFVAVAYDANGNMLDSTMVKGYFLERVVDYAEATEAGHNAAILQGDYKIVPGVSSQKYDWYLSNVPGRGGIAIHSGNYYYESKGCLFPGESYGYIKNSKAYFVSDSKKCLTKLSNLFKQYGNQNIRIKISEDF